MDIARYDALRHFADSWGLVYMVVIFLVVLAFVLRRGAREQAVIAARIPLADDEPAAGDPRR